MCRRREELEKLKLYTEGIDSELTMILQSLQWDRNHLLQNPVKVMCRYDSNHKIPPDKSNEHERECFLRLNGYSKDDHLLPDPLNTESSTLVTLGKSDIEQIIRDASQSNILFKKVYRKTVQGPQQQYPFYIGCHGVEPMSLERLQSSYTPDERRAIYDAVVSAVPSCHDLADLALLSGDAPDSKVKILSRLEILAELRNMRRRRTKYRVAAKTRNYSDVLRDVIRTQMEHYNEEQTETAPNETTNELYINKQTDNSKHGGHIHSKQESSGYDNNRYDRRRRLSPRLKIITEIKREREDFTERNRSSSKETSNRSYRYKESSRERYDRDQDRHRYDDREKRNNEDKRSSKYQQQSRKRRYDEGSETHNRYRYEERTREMKHEASEERTREIKREVSNERGNNYELGSEYEPKIRSRKCRKNQDHDLVYQENKEKSNEDRRKHNKHKESTGERRYDDDANKYNKHKDRTKDRKYNETFHRDRSRERQSRRYNESREIICTKQQRGESTRKEDKSEYAKYKSNDWKHKMNEGRCKSSYRDRNNERNDSEQPSKKVKYDSDYESPAEEMYNPNKKIKDEK